MFWIALLILLPLGCAERQPFPTQEIQSETAVLVGFTIQAGAFSHLDNAVRLSRTLQANGLDATFFRDNDNLYKVRFGNFTDADTARTRAEYLKKSDVIDAYYIVAPHQQTAAQRRDMGDDWVRQKIVKTAKGFIGIPYKWGGESAATGFDCSGLTMTAYELNGYSLPRNSRAQYAAGKPVAYKNLAPADLVFFAIETKKSVSHVGLYIGGGRFVHAPGKGKTIRTDKLGSGYFRRHFIGARSFL